MKTPQEEAEEMAYNCRESIASGEGLVPNPVCDKLMEETILKTIPLAELISVARAAVEMLSDLQTFGSGDLDYEWEKALQALRATGKVKL